MMDITTIGMYLASMGLAGFFGAMLLETVDRKSDEMAGFRERKIKIKRKFKR